MWKSFKVNNNTVRCLLGKTLEEVGRTHLRSMRQKENQLEHYSNSPGKSTKQEWWAQRGVDK